MHGAAPCGGWQSLCHRGTASAGIFAAATTATSAATASNTTTATATITCATTTLQPPPLLRGEGKAINDAGCVRG
jgi:hypothetical protein